MEKEKNSQTLVEGYRKYIHKFCDEITDEALLKRLYYVAQHYWLGEA